MKIERGFFRRIWHAPFAPNSHGLAVDSERVTILARKPRTIDLSSLAGLSRVRARLLSAAVEVPLQDGSLFVFAGVSRIQATSFVDTLNDAWIRGRRADVESYLEPIRALAKDLDRLSDASQYPAASKVQPLWREAEKFLAVLPKSSHDLIFARADQRCISKIIEFHRDPDGHRKKMMRQFIDKEISEMSQFFDTVEAQSLTDEQRYAVICDEDATLVLAGAGSGKTSVISAKAAYLIKRQIRAPEQILLMAYAKDAAKEMSERIAKICEEDVAVATFHSLGYEIIAAVEQKKPLLASSASDEKLLFKQIREILVELAKSERRIRKLLFRWFTEFFLPAKSEWDFSTRHEYLSYVEAYELRTLNGEKVRSFEELMIANWLCMSGIVYEYEPVYEHQPPELKGKPYTPDFRLVESGIYIEHFGVRRETGDKGDEVLTTAPYVDRERYLAQMDWKRQVHKKFETTLIETFSYENSEGQLLSSLEEKLAPYVEFKPVSMKRILALLSSSGEFDDFTKMMVVFLRHFKGSGQTIADCRSKINQWSRCDRELAFLNIFECVFQKYQERLGDQIDFEDMIARAARYIRENRYRSRFRHLLVDEFQDISATRASLLMAMKAQHPDTRIFAVGDDWQSIYRFAGSDTSLMHYFGSNFGGQIGQSTGVSRTVKLERTFRCVDRIAYPARRFVLQNPSQIEKNVVPADCAAIPAISIFWNRGTHYGEQLHAALDRIAEDFNHRASTVLLLGRYNGLKPKNLEEINRRHRHLSVSFKTIHSSKGLEADHVIILGADKGRHGLPSEMTDDPILWIVLPQQEQFEHAEERRVFYVALTRARKSVAVLARKDRPSSFVEELLSDERYGVSEHGFAQTKRYACARCGGQMLLSRKNRYVCEHWDNCDASLPACSACGIGLPVPSETNSTVSQCQCGAKYDRCGQCVDGWLVKRSGKYGQFLDCVNYPSCRSRKSSSCS